MASLKEVRNRIKSVISTQQITKAMKMVAASKLRKAQDRILQMRPFAEKLNEILQNVVTATGNSGATEFAAVREVNKVLIVAVTSDRGLCGAFNSNVLKRVHQLAIEEFPEIRKEGNLHVLPIGKKAAEHFAKRNDYKTINDFWEIFHDLTFEKVREAAEFTMHEFLNENYDKVIIVYNEFKNVATQLLKVEQFLPLTQEESPAERVLKVDYILEPSEEYIVKELIPQSLRIQFYKVILESNASENGARMTAMDQATENANEILADLRISYNRTRQAAITKEILEIVGGAEALASS